VLRRGIRNVVEELGMDTGEAAGRPTSDETGIGKRPVGIAGIVITACLLVAACGVVIYSIIEFWPPTQPALAPGETAETAELEVSWFGAHLSASEDDLLFVVVALFGFLGALVHALRSLYWYVGNRTFLRSWLLFYAIVPFVGASLGVLVYVVLRGGLISPQASSADVSPFGFAAVAGLVGLFTQESARKLLQVFEVILTPAEKGSEHTPPRNEPTEIAFESFSPTSGPPGTEVVLLGRGFAGVGAVTFGDVPAAVQSVAASEIVVTVPAGATSAPIRINIGRRTFESREPFDVTEPGS
jgi:hypothetical protein